MVDWLEKTIRILKKDNLESLVMILLVAWNTWNAIVINPKIEMTRNIVIWPLAYKEEFQRVQTKASPYLQPGITHWKGLCANLLKVNFNASFDEGD